MIENRLDDVRFLLLDATVTSDLGFWPSHVEAGIVSIIREADGVPPHGLFIWPHLDRMTSENAAA